MTHTVGPFRKIIDIFSFTYIIDSQNRYNAKASLRMVLDSYIDSRVETILANREPSRDDILSRIPQ